MSNRTYVLCDSNTKWWWYFLHPMMGEVLGHYGFCECDRESYKKYSKYGYHRKFNKEINEWF